jgi:hypothetical protein
MRELLKMPLPKAFFKSKKHGDEAVDIFVGF